MLFAEDPGLNLVDFICVAMLLRIRWQLLRADYSSALTVLLRYPVPKEPHGPITFIEDALLLRGDMSIRTGSQLVAKYTGRAPRSQRLSIHSPTPRSPARPPIRGPQGIGATSPLRFPSQLFQDSRIEDLIQGAAKGMYKQTERLGLQQAFREAVQGLQSGNSSPRRSTPTSRWSLDRGRDEGDLEDQLRARVRAVNRRNKELARLLQVAMGDLSGQICHFEEVRADQEAANSLALILAKLQYVQIYLEDASLPLAGSSSPVREEQSNKQDDRILVKDGREASPGASGNRGDSVGGHEKSFSAPSDLPLRRRSSSRTGGAVASTLSPTRRPKSKVAQDVNARTESPLRTSFQHPRPSLAESSLSWMLGGSPANAHFGSASPFSPEQERKGQERKTGPRGKSAFLFGDEKPEKADSEAHKLPPAKEDSEGFTLGTLKGGAHRSPRS